MKERETALGQKSRTVLGWPELLSALSARAESEPGKRLCLEPPEYDRLSECETAMAETGEMLSLLEAGETPPATNFRELRPAVETARAEGVLEPADLLAISDLLFYSEATRVFFSSHRQATRLLEHASRLDPQKPLRQTLERSLDRDGKLLDTASPELQDLRRRHDRLKEKIHRRLSELVSQDPEAILQDSFYTVRNQRYVLPVKASHRADLAGIVHDTSQSGQTVFLEPAELVEPNNQLKLLEAEIAAEERRILRELSRQVANVAAALLENQAILTHLDLVRARARLSQDLRGHRPRLNDRARVRLFSARHPLLLLRRQEVVANDLHLGEDYQVLVISGPNAGGKTVGLTMLGLFALMVRIGLFLPAGPDSEMALFSAVYAVIGDEQDLSRDLSSFSGHLLDLREILALAGPNSLVLLDELMNSTDPAEAGALGSAVLLALRDQGATVLATTHFPTLKSFAHHQPGFQNASYSFDPKTLQPTYRLLIGTPGRSLGLELAARLGLPEKILERARGEMDDAANKMESLLGEVSARLDQLEQERRDLLQTHARLKKEIQNYEELREKTEERERELKREAKATLRTIVKKAEEEIEKLLVTTRKKPALTAQDLSQVRDQLHSLQEKTEMEIGEPGPRGEIPDWATLKPGQKVALLPLLVEAELLEVPAVVRDETKVKVRVGQLTVMVEAKKVRLIAPKKESLPSILKPPAPKKRREKKEEKASPATVPTYGGPLLPPNPTNTLDLRGKRVHEAEVMVEQFLDRSCREHKINVFIIHGHGTEALKKLVRQLVAESPYVESFRPGEKDEGGDGVTMVQLKEWGLP